MQLGVFYRSDLREPNQIFPHGFQKRKPAFAKPELRFSEKSAEKAPDIQPGSGVCVSRHFEAAALFPVEQLSADAYIYACQLDATKLFNTQEKQYEFAVKRGFAHKDLNLWPMFGQERAANSIPPEAIVGAVRITRKPTGMYWFTGLRFRAETIHLNHRFSSSPQLVDQFQSLTQRLLGQWISCPTMAQGYVKLE